MEGLAGRQASKMLIRSVLNPRDVGEGESTSLQAWQGLLQAMESQAFPGGGATAPGHHWKVPPVVVGVAAALSVGGLLYLLLSWCRCFGRRTAAAMKGADV